MRPDKKILVVEDDEELRDAMAMTLRRNRYAVTSAKDIRDATFKLKNQTYDCILLDMRLGHEFGEDLIEIIRQRKDALNLETPIVVVSGNLDRDLVAKIAGMVQGALVKPFEMKALLEIVQKQFDPR